MKIGILTYNKANNYGAVLQSYALTNIIKSILKCECEIINYNSDFFDKIYRNKTIVNSKNIKELIKNIIMHKHYVKKDKNFKKFEQNFLCLSTTEYNKKNIRDSIKIYDMFIVGSDQVWNFDLNGNDSTFALDFVPKNKCISYAASIGGNHLSDYSKDILTRNLDKYKLISVREKSAIPILKELISDVSITDVLDPTLLLTREKWEKLIGKRIIEEEYVFLYKVADTPSIINYVNNYHKDIKKIILHASHKNYHGFLNLKDISPLEFLNLIYYSKINYTTSFHGICFSILFNKNFYYELDNKSSNNNSRIEDLINILNLENRKIEEGFIKTTETINYKKVNKILDEKRKMSYNFIKKIGDYNEK